MKGAAPIMGSVSAVQVCRTCREEEGVVMDQEGLQQCVDIVANALEELGVKGLKAKLEVCLKPHGWFESQGLENGNQQGQIEAVTMKENMLFGMFRSAQVFVRLLVE